MANNVEAIAGMAEDATVEATVPTIMVALSAGNAIKAALPNVQRVDPGGGGPVRGCGHQCPRAHVTPRPRWPGLVVLALRVSHVPNGGSRRSTRTSSDNVRLD